MRRTKFDLMSPGVRDELIAIEKELLALDPMYGLAEDSLREATMLVWIDRRTAPKEST